MSREHRERAEECREIAHSHRPGIFNHNCREVLAEMVEIIDELADIVGVLVQDEQQESNQAVSLEISVEGRIMSAVTIKETEKVTLSGVTKNAAGVEVPAAGPLTWSSTDPLVALTPSVDTYSAVAEGTVGTATVTVTDGTLSGTCDVTVEADVTPASLEIVPGTPEAK